MISEEFAESIVTQILQPYFRRLYRDLEDEVRKRKINQFRLTVLRRVEKLPEKIGPDWQRVTQVKLDEAREVGTTILSNFNSEWLRYDSKERPPSILPGSYGSRQ